MAYDVRRGDGLIGRHFAVQGGTALPVRAKSRHENMPQIFEQKHVSDTSNVDNSVDDDSVCDYQYIEHDSMGKNINDDIDMSMTEDNINDVKDKFAKDHSSRTGSIVHPRVDNDVIEVEDNRHRSIGCERVEAVKNHKDPSFFLSIMPRVVKNVFTELESETQESKASGEFKASQFAKDSRKLWFLPRVAKNVVTGLKGENEGSEASRESQASQSADISEKVYAEGCKECFHWIEG